MMCGDVNSTEMPEPYTAAEAEASLITGEHLRMRAIGEPPLMRDLAPGRPVIWEVGVRADAPDPGGDLGLSGRGELAEIPGALLVSVRSCSEPWSRGRCPIGAEELLGAESLDRIAHSAPTRHLTTMPSDEQCWLRIEVTLQKQPLQERPGAAGAEGDLLIHAVGSGEEVTTSPDGRRATPGVPAQGSQRGRRTT